MKKLASTSTPEYWCFISYRHADNDLQKQDSIRLQNLSGQANIRLGRFDEAIAHLRIALDAVNELAVMNPDTDYWKELAMAHSYLGVAHNELKNNGEARKHFLRYLDIMDLRKANGDLDPEDEATEMVRKLVTELEN